MEVGRDDRNLDQFVGVGEGRHGGAGEQRRLEAVAARGTVFNDEVREAFAQAVEETVGCEDLLAQTFAESVGMVGAEAEGFVVVDF